MSGGEPAGNLIPSSVIHCKKAVAAMLLFHPKPGTILLCDYGSERQPPEMTKRRPVVVVAPKLKRRTDLTCVVALSTTPPTSPQDYHCAITLDPPLPVPFDSPDMWVKADMIDTVGFHRLDLFRGGRDQYGKRKFFSRNVTPGELAAIKKAVLFGLGMGGLTPHL